MEFGHNPAAVRWLVLMYIYSAVRAPHKADINQKLSKKSPSTREFREIRKRKL